MTEATDVIVRVVAHLVPLVQHALVELRMLAHVVAHHEEGGLDVVALQRLENEGRGLRYGTIVESQIDDLLVMVHTPQSPWIEPAQVDGWLLYNHLHSQFSTLALEEAYQLLQLGFHLLSLLGVDELGQLLFLLHEVQVIHALAL